MVKSVPWSLFSRPGFGFLLGDFRPSGTQVLSPSSGWSVEHMERREACRQTPLHIKYFFLFFFFFFLHKIFFKVKIYEQNLLSS